MFRAKRLNVVQQSQVGLCPVSDALDNLAHHSTADDRGAIFTRREVVEFILDLAGYVTSAALHKKTLLEPSFGGGDFLLPAIERLLAAWKKAAKAEGSPPKLDDCIRAVELHKHTYVSTRQSVLSLLARNGISSSEATRIANKWLIHADYLLLDVAEGGFDFVVGNPPYVRQEAIAEPLLAEYRRRYKTLYDRADLYVPFIERSLRLLNDDGRLVFICADRWIKNQYGGPLRELVAKDYWLRVYVDMVGTDAFHSFVTAYPAVTVIQKSNPGPTRVAERPNIDSKRLKALAKDLIGTKAVSHPGVYELSEVTRGDAPWLLHADGLLQLVRRVEGAFQSIEDAGCKIGIGVATGADRVYVAPYDSLDIEDDRKVPLAMTQDLKSGRMEWRGYAVVNPFTDDGSLVDLKSYPRLSAYLHLHQDAIVRRHVAKKNSDRWYRTIDRITPALAKRSKLLIPDIKGDAQVVFDEGRLYPHHNLYYIVSDEWDLHALQAVLLSSLTRLFIATYSTKMRGDCLRFQAQYLRRLRLPRWETVPEQLRKSLIEASRTLDLRQCNNAVARLYKLTTTERAELENWHVSQSRGLSRASA